MIKFRLLIISIMITPLCLLNFANSQAIDNDRQHHNGIGKHWSIEPQLSIEGTYSDNIALTPPGNEKSDFVSEITPALDAKIDGNRVKGELSYRMQNLIYAENSNFNETYHQYHLNGNAELWREKFFLDTNSTLRQRNITSQRFVTGNRNIDTNRTDQLTASIRPYYKQRLGTQTEVLLQYEYGIVDFEDEKVLGTTSDSRLNDVLLAVGSSNKQEDHLPSWSLRYSFQDIRFDSDDFDDLTFKQTAVELIFPITAGLGLITEGGYENNDLTRSSFNGEKTKGTLWQAGFHWQPTPKTRLEARFGNRFFGNTGLLRWQQRGFYLTTDLRYSKDIGGYTGYALRETSPNDIPLQFSTNALGLTARAFIRKRLDASARIQILKSQIAILIFDEERDFKTVENNKERWTGIRPSFEWSFASRTTLTTSIEWGKLKPSGVQRNDYPLRGVISLRREIGQRTQANLTYIHARLYSDDPSFEYRENTISIGISQRF